MAYKLVPLTKKNPHDLAIGNCIGDQCIHIGSVSHSALLAWNISCRTIRYPAYLYPTGDYSPYQHEAMIVAICTLPMKSLLTWIIAIYLTVLLVKHVQYFQHLCWPTTFQPCWKESWAFFCHLKNAPCSLSKFFYYCYSEVMAAMVVLLFEPFIHACHHHLWLWNAPNCSSPSGNSLGAEMISTH